MKKSIMSLPVILIMMMVMTSSVSAVSITAPAGYSMKSFNTDDVWVYEILESNGVVIGWGSFAGNYTTEVGGTIEIKLLGFYDTLSWAGIIPNVPHFNMTFKLKNGQINDTIANISNTDAAYLLTLNIGSFLPGILAKVNWTENTATANAAANDPITSFFSTNGTLDIDENSKKITYQYTQNPLGGNQNTTITYDKETGVIKAWDSEVWNYNLKAELKSSFIPGFPTEIISLISIGIVAVLIMRIKKQVH